MMEKNSNHVLITGAHGFIGRHMAKSIAELGYKVIGFGYGSWEESEWKNWGLSQWIEGNITEDQLKKKINFSPELIFHCAGSGSVGFSFDNPVEDFYRNVYTLLNLLEFIRKNSLHSKTIHLSSAAVYGNNYFPASEDCMINPTSPYGFHKKIAEELCEFYGKSYNVLVSSVRLFSVYGPELRKQLLWDLCEKYKNNYPIFFGTGNESRDFIHISDVTRLLFLAVQKASSSHPIFNGGTGVSTKVIDIIKNAFHHLNYNEMPLFSGKARNGDPAHLQANIQKANNLLGWKPVVQIDLGIRDYVNWYKKYYL